MHIPITRHGIGVLVWSTALLALLGLGLSWISPWLWFVPAIVWIWALSFFRDPQRDPPALPGVLYSPADGKITEVAALDHHEVIDTPAVRIRIFLSIFNVHINRMPCSGIIERIDSKAGKFINAMRPESSELNESKSLIIKPADPWSGPLMVRQISGLIARTIVCDARVGDELASGARFGMIKFGSGTELVVPGISLDQVRVKVGDRVQAGLTELVVAKAE